MHDSISTYKWIILDVSILGSLLYTDTLSPTLGMDLSEKKNYHSQNISIWELRFSFICLDLVMIYSRCLVTCSILVSTYETY